MFSNRTVGVIAPGIVATLCLCSTAAAARDLTSIRAMGMGGALRASATGIAAPRLNPAGMSLARMYVMGASYQFRGSDAASQVNTAVVDSITAKLAAGLNYSYVHASPEQVLAHPDGAFELNETLQTHEVGLSLSMPLGQAVFLGVSGKYINHKGELPEQTPEGVRPADISTLSLDVGGIVRLGEVLSLAVVGYNLAEVGDPSYPQALGLGAALQLSTLLLDFDTTLDFSSADAVKPAFHGGAELFIDKKYGVRAGVMHDRLRQATYVAGGLGLTANRTSLEFGLRQMVAGGAETLFGFSLQLFIQSM